MEGKGKKLQRGHGLRGPSTSVRNRARSRTRATGSSTGRKQLRTRNACNPSGYLAPPRWEVLGDNIRQLVNWKRGGDVGITELVERVGKRATRIVENTGIRLWRQICAFVRGGCDGGGTCAALDMFEGGVRTRTRGDRIRTCRSKLDLDQVNDKVGGTRW